MHVVESKLGPIFAFFESKLGPRFIIFLFVFQRDRETERQRGREAERQREKERERERRWSFQKSFQSQHHSRVSYVVREWAEKWEIGGRQSMLLCMSFSAWI